MLSAGDVSVEESVADVEAIGVEVHRAKTGGREYYGHNGFRVEHVLLEVPVTQNLVPRAGHLWRTAKDLNSRLVEGGPSVLSK